MFLQAVMISTILHLTRPPYARYTDSFIARATDTWPAPMEPVIISMVGPWNLDGRRFARFVVVFRRLYDLNAEIFERIVDWNDIWKSFNVYNAFYAAFRDQAFADAARVGGYVESCTCEFYAAVQGIGKHALFRAYAIADFAPRAGRNLLYVAYAADYGAVIAFVKAVVARREHAAAAHGNSRHFGAQACGLRPELFELFKKFFIRRRKRHSFIIPSTDTLFVFPQ